MSYKNCVATLQRLRKEHKDDPVAMRMLDNFSRDIALQRAEDEVSAMMKSMLAIDRAIGISTPPGLEERARAAALGGHLGPTLTNQ